MRRVAGLVAVVGAVACAAAGVEARGQGCGRPDFAMGNVGYGAGFSMSVGRWGGWCGPRPGWCGTTVGWCPPVWGGCTPVWGWCAPRRGWGPGWCGPGWGQPWGWSSGFVAGWPWCGFGGGWSSGCGSVSLVLPTGGAFFSGSLVPVPACGWGYPAVSPWSLGAIPTPPITTTIASRAAIVPGPTVGDMVARAGRAAPQTSLPGPIRPANQLARLRAARLVAVGDRQLREAAAHPARLRQALDSYRRAAGIAADQPDTFVRQAVTLVALGRRAEADTAAARAAALDGRLTGRTADRRRGPGDPVFDGGVGDGVPPLARRGAEILTEIGARGTGADDVRWLAGLWSERFGLAHPRQAAATAVAAAPRPQR